MALFMNNFYHGRNILTNLIAQKQVDNCLASLVIYQPTTYLSICKHV